VSFFFPHFLFLTHRKSVDPLPNDWHSVGAVASIHPGREQARRGKFWEKEA
jgi:hypothetical protein